MDLSFPYLKKAQQNLSDFSRINFLQGAAEELPFANDTFDAVYSCFLFHELPFEIRKKVIAEGHRVLKTGGTYGLVDSVQKEDTKDFEWALEQFPTNFHEPFFKNYIMNPIEGQIIHAGYKDVKTHSGFLSKSVLGVK
jgi:ubiquinone/menaquinone biosynthesis C-methylase UbiE